MSRSDQGHSLRGRLLGFLLGAVVLTSLVQALIAYGTALAEADVLFDHHLQRTAESLRSGVHLGLLQANDQVRTDMADEDYVVQMWNAKGEPVFESAAHRSLRSPASPGFSLVTARDKRIYRVFVLRTPTQLIQVAQDMGARSNMARSLAIRTVWPTVVMALILLIVVWWVVRNSLAPVANVRAQMAARKADDLSCISEDGLPDEIRPLIQELNLLFERLARAFDVQKSFVADAAHELRSPLAALKIQVQGLQRASDEATREVAVKRLSAGIERAGHLVDQLLVLARQEASHAQGVAFEISDVSQIGLLCLTDHLLQAQMRGIDLGVHRTEVAMAHVQLDAMRVLIRNVLDNAIKYTPEGGTVDLDIHHTPAGAVICVEDSGPGIAEADRSRVLDRFYRVSGSGQEGSGLGLAIVKSIADMHQAVVVLDQSDRLGGLRVRVRLRPV
ncbi:MAG: HAMP domain-containing protein [Aquabacterium sp.]|uniref:ATP-binding protein n=1 Tax=Aquabacterium sp. TaxID=1872578 RepID=UPI00121DC89F|nr:ATP-binding protein [Aquabacterium sp.]TAK94644.1 MAG: HAMP domain-containing protein [Aquabacterium sp.]